MKFGLYFIGTELDSFALFYRFNVEDRSVISHVFHQWAKKKAFQDPKRLLDKVISRYFDFVLHLLDSVASFAFARYLLVKYV
jgi:hypothetical protein